tara:strand:+ start:273 stop:485 length:213 start_codon:yes stop_codon:yes gene_type:complete
MDKKNIITEGFFDRFKKAFLKQKTDKKTKLVFSKNKKVQKKYEDAMNQAEKALKKGAELEKEFGIPPIKY